VTLGCFALFIDDFVVVGDSPPLLNPGRDGKTPGICDGSFDDVTMGGDILLADDCDRIDESLSEGFGGID